LTSSELPGPTWTATEIQASCDGGLHLLALKGIQLFNQEQFFEAHEELELAWREERGPIRDVYRGILQVGLGYYHIQRGNYKGAVKMFQRCRSWLAPYPSVCRGIDVERLRQDYQRAEAELLRLGAERLAEFNRAYIRPVVFADEK
jgi:uncharacterized protein